MVEKSKRHPFLFPFYARNLILSLSLSLHTILKVIFLTEILYKVFTSAVHKAIIFLVSSVSPHLSP